MPKSPDPIRTFEEYHNKIVKRLRKQSHHRFYFRGVSNKSFALIPKVGRDNKQIVDQERSMFKRFKKSGRPLTQHSINDLEWLFLAQHHGLPTRLLDWTTNPMVALYFAVQPRSHIDDSKRIDSAVFVLKTQGENKELSSKQKENPFDVKGVRVLSPPAISRRIIAQSAMFTIQADPNSDMRKLVNQKKMVVDQIIISKDSCAELQKILARYGFHPFSMFPDLDGLAKHISLFYKWPVRL